MAESTEDPKRPWWSRNARDAATEPVQAISFGIGGNDANYLGDGWSGPEQGFRWTLGRTSEIWLERSPQGGDCRLELDVLPFCREPDVPRQRLTVRVRDTVVGRAIVTTRRILAFRIPGAVMAEPGPLKLQLEHPDARAPADVGGRGRRVLALCVHGLSLRRCPADELDAGLEAGGGLTIAAMERETGAAAAEYMLGFESLGDNCEFGLVQQRCGAEPMGLLRFASMPLPNLLRALETRFEKLGDPKNLTISLAGRGVPEYMIHDHAYGLRYHSWKKAGSIDPQAFLAQQVGRLHLLRRKLIEDLTEARKVFVWKSNQPATEAEARALHAALGTYGPNTLLWVTASDPAVVPGVVEPIAPGLFHGTTDRFAPSSAAHDLTLDLWLLLCVEADRMRKAARVASGA